VTLAEALVKAGELLENRPRPYRGPFGALYENLLPQLLGGAERFVTGYQPILSSTLVVLGDNVPITASSIDEETGEFNVDPMPLQSLVARYHYKRFTDLALTEVISNATNRLLFATVDTVLPGLFPAFWHYVRGEGYTVLATRYAEQVNVTIGPRSEGREAISRQFQAMAKEEFELGDKARDDFYTKAGQREDPARGRAVFRIPAWMPRR